jgi:hypothetical protein
MRGYWIAIDDRLIEYGARRLGANAAFAVN